MPPTTFSSRRLSNALRSSPMAEGWRSPTSLPHVWHFMSLSIAATSSPLAQLARQFTDIGVGPSRPGQRKTTAKRTNKYGPLSVTKLPASFTRLC
jgi:hypothetical protein